MDTDDNLIGRIFTRREVMQIFGATLMAGAGHSAASRTASSSAAPLPSCIVHPEQTEGPFFKDVELDRSDIRIDPSTREVSAGLPLEITFQILRVSRGGCTPLPSAKVDLWQCDAAGRYSGFRDRGSDLREEKFLRGYQLTDQDGVAKFTTVYPGWYRGRTVHIHLKVRTETEEGKGYEFSTQLYFDDDLTDQVYARSPYRQRGKRTTRNSNDGIYRRTGRQLMLDLKPGDAGYQAVFPIGLDLPGTN